MSGPTEITLGSLELLDSPAGERADLSFEAMGTTVRVQIGAPTRPDLPPAAEAAAALRAWIESYDRRLSRFRDESELCELNADSAPVHEASPLLRTLVSAALEAAEVTGGLVDPTLVSEIEEAGYERSRSSRRDRILGDALTGAPRRRPGAPNPGRRWRSISVNEGRGTISRPPGLRIDSGGIGKGLAADLAAERLRGYCRYLVDCGGDIQVGGAATRLDPYAVAVAHPLDSSLHREVLLGSGAVATSGIDARIWRRGQGYAHHLLDPSTGEPAWTGVISATALAPDAVRAEALAKAALLAGPAGAREHLSDYGGLFVLDDGSHVAVARGAGDRPEVAA